MVLPEKILVLDDYNANAERIIIYLTDLFWIEDFHEWKESQDDADLKIQLNFDEKEIRKKIENIDNRIKSFFKTDRYHFKEKVVKKVIKTSQNAVEAELFIENIKKSKTAAVAFIDFLNEFDDASTYLSKLYSQLPQGSKWKKSTYDKLDGGYYFSSLFEPSFMEKRIICFTTVAQPSGYTNDATVCGSTARSYLDALDSVIIMLNEWAKLFWDPTLDDIWRNTIEWFKDNNVRDTQNPTHCHPFVTGVFENKDSYKDNIRKVFGLEFPVEWFEDKTSFMILHESLKSLCGSTYCGTLSRQDQRNLYIGAVYLIAILAMRDAGKYCNLTTNDQGITFQLKDYQKLTSKFLPLQSEDEAKNTAKALYAVFYNSFRKEDRHGNKGLKQFSIMSEGKKLQFTFEWSASQKDGLSKKLKEKQLSDQQEKDSATLRGAIQCLLMNMTGSSMGFGSPGTIWMEDKDLYIASANSPARALIVCSDSGSDGRGKKWAELFLNTEVSEVYVAKNSGEIILYRHNIDDCRTIEIKDFPQTFVCVMVHQGDSILWDNLKKDYNLQFNKLFRFSGPGIYNTADGLPIMRITSADFDITVKDVIEVVDYSSGKRKEIPAVCKPKPAKEVLSAISIFCQGYLMAGVAVGKIDKKDEEDVKLLIGWNDQVKDTFPALLEFGWEKAKNPKWWFSEEQIKYLKEYANRDLGEHPYSNVKKLIGYIAKGNDIEDYKVIKEAFEELVEMGKKK